MNCPKCGENLVEIKGNLFCSGCGSKVDKEGTAIEDQNQPRESKKEEKEIDPNQSKPEVIEYHSPEQGIPNLSSDSQSPINLGPEKSASHKSKAILFWVIIFIALLVVPGSAILIRNFYNKKNTENQQGEKQDFPSLETSRYQSRNTERRKIANDAKSGLEAYYSIYKKYPEFKGTVYELLRTEQPNGIKGLLSTLSISTPPSGFTDPSGEENRICYSNIGQNEYWMYFNPEPNSVSECEFEGPFCSPLEDFSVINDYQNKCLSPSPSSKPSSFPTSSSSINQIGARDSQRKADIRDIQMALEIYFTDYAHYPTLVTDLTSGDLPYITSIPTDPVTGADYIYTPSGTPPSTYSLSATLENENDTGPGVTNGVYTVTNKQ